MNEKIKEFALQAGIVYEKRPELDVWIAFNIELEKFAELIVAECVAVIEPGEFMQGTAHNDTKKIIALNQRKIKRHFGVEE